jgi:LysR family glycine cleavage system transcriptional activator
MQRRPPLQLLPAFEASARLSSFKKAAAELHVTPSAISQQIRSLEDHIDMPLFDRLARRVELTDAGKQLFDIAQRLMSDFDRAYQSFRDQHQRPVLRVSMTAFTAYELVLPRLHEFQQQHPEIDVRIETSMALADFSNDMVDAALRFGTTTNPVLETLPLAQARATLVGAPDQLSQKPITCFDDVFAHTLIHTRRTPNDWAFAARKLGVDDFKPKQEMFLDDYFSAMLAARQGLGVALAILPITGAWLLDGRLTAPFPWAIQTEQDFHYVFRKTRHPRRGVMEFYHWIKQVFDDFAARCPL